MMMSSEAFKTPIGGKIELATQRDLPVTDWALNLEICDMINSAQDGPQAGVKAVRARLQQRDDKVIENVLILLDTLVKNCGRRLHLLIAQRDFMCDLIRLVSPRDPTPQHVKDRALTLIERCSDAFANDKDLSAVGEAYQYLKSQSVQFPAQNLDDMVAIHTPRATNAAVDPAPAPTARGPPPPTGHLPAAAPTGYTPAPPYTPPAVYTPVVFTPQPVPQPLPAQYHPSGISRNDLQRLNKELLVVRGNDGVMNDILVDLQSNPNPNPDELLLLRDLHRTCKEMYTRMVALLEQVVEEGLVCQLLDLIDKLNNSFVRYDRYERNLVLSAPADPRTGAPVPLPAQPPHQPAQGAVQAPAQGAVQPTQAPAQGAVQPTQPQEDARNIYATPNQTQASSRQTTGAVQQRGSDIEELLSLEHPDPVYTEHPDPVYTEPTTQHPSDSSTNPFQEFMEAPISRLPPLSGNEEDENIYTTCPGKVPARPVATDSIEVSLSDMIVDEFDMFAESRSSTLSDRVQVASSEAAYEAAHDVPQSGSLAGAVHNRCPVDPGDDTWLHDLNTVEPTSHAMSNEEFDRFLNERAPAPPTTALQDPRKADDDLLAL